jgi:nitrate reductase gamma subunit
MLLLFRHFEDKGKWWTSARKSDLTRWILTMVTGFFCGIVAILVAFSTNLITRYKFDHFNTIIEREKAGEAMYGTAYFFLFGINILFGLVAWICVFMEPLAGGSGSTKPF